MYAFSGLFAARFNAGHVTFAFFHLIPVVMYAFDVGFERALAGKRITGWCVAAALAAFLFVTAGLPHSLIHFYPAFLLLVVLRIVFTGRRTRILSGLRAAALPLVPTCSAACSRRTSSGP